MGHGDSAVKLDRSLRLYFGLHAVPQARTRTHKPFYPSLLLRFSPVFCGASAFVLFFQEVSIILPDEAELDRAAEDEGGAEVSKGVTLRTLRTSG